MPQPAAFGRLCVETKYRQYHGEYRAPAAFGRLCVETDLAKKVKKEWAQPPSGGCVLKQCFENIEVANDFPAAFGRLCVETVE